MIFGLFEAKQHTFVIRRDKTKDVRVVQHRRLVNFDFTEPGLLISRREDLDGNFLGLPVAFPHFAEPSFTDNLFQLNRPGHGPLYQ